VNQNLALVALVDLEADRHMRQARAELAKSFGPGVQSMESNGNEYAFSKS